MLEAWYNTIPSCHWLHLTSSPCHKNKNMPKYNFESQKRNFHTKYTMHSKAVLPMLRWIFVSLVIICTITCGAVTCRELAMGLMVCLNFHINNTFNHFYANDNKNWPNNKRYLLHINDKLQKYSQSFMQDSTTEFATCVSLYVYYICPIIL